MVFCDQTKNFFFSYLGYLDPFWSGLGRRLGKDEFTSDGADGDLCSRRRKDKEAQDTFYPGTGGGIDCWTGGPTTFLMPGQGVYFFCNTFFIIYGQGWGRNFFRDRQK